MWTAILFACTQDEVADTASESMDSAAEAADTATSDTGDPDPCRPGKGPADANTCVGFRLDVHSDAGATTDGMVQSGLFTDSDPITLTGTVKNTCNTPETLADTAARDCAVKAFVVTEADGTVHAQQSVCGPSDDDTVLSPGQSSASTWAYGTLSEGTHNVAVCWDWTDVPALSFDLVVEAGP